ncbi:YihY family inner membrane protein [Scytonema sp. UIC 10036]|uniref:YihY/virulence factor BrkB family protein n=1 Tax=Scytonema sp. UIC 10036 TaxID=2304196 RepID=UPI0012DAEA94|nr:YihY/virulence factor BrkB family protein [Scytonema sp. UIC 10036]MUH01014.1 YihY family inner membrane protein [Scytonema sp. UIC 10036]
MLSTRFFRFFRHLNWKTLRQIVVETGKQRLFGLSAEMAYNNLLALFPSLVAILAAIGMLAISQETVNFLPRQVLSIAPEPVLNLIEEFISTIKLPQGEKVVFISCAVALWVASGAINTAMSALDQIYQIPFKQRRPFWLAKIIALGLTFGTISLVISASFLAFISDLLIKFALELDLIPASGILSAWKLFGWVLTLIMLAVAFSLVYRFGPSRWRRGTPLLPGAIISALLWETVSRLFRIYINHFSDYNLTYGTLSAGIVLLLWLNLSSFCMLIGAQLNVTIGKAMNTDNMHKNF